MDDPKITIGDREFLVPEFNIKQQRIVTPLLMKVAGSTTDLTNAEGYGSLLDAVYTCLTVPTRDGSPLNDISKDDFEDLKTGPVVIATAVLPFLMMQAGLKPPTAGLVSVGGAGDATPGTPLNGETTSTT